MRGRLLVLFALSLALSVAGAGIALAAAKKAAKAPIQGTNANCGANETGDPVLGAVGYKRSGTTVTVKVSLKKGTPNTKYGVALYGNGCEGIASGTSFTTNKKGVGKVTDTFTVPAEDSEFFATVYEEKENEAKEIEFGIANDTPYVALAP